MKVEYLIELLLTLVVGYLLYRIMSPFFIPIFWAVIFVILFYPYYNRLRKRLRNKGLASLIACATIALFLIVPMAIVGTALANEMFGLYQWAEGYIKSVRNVQPAETFIAPIVEKYLSPYVDITPMEAQNHILNVIKQGSNLLAKGVKGAIRNLTESVFNIFVAFFVMYFLFRDADKIMHVVRDILPISNAEKKKVFAKNRIVITATFLGGVLIGAIQATLGGLAFWFLGLPSPVLWGFMMFLLSFIPAVGTGLVWGPAVLYLLISGFHLKAGILLIWGVFIVGLADNILRPVIVSGKTHQHPLLLFFCILGAVNAFGIIGIIAGPIILSLAQAILDIYRTTLKNKALQAS